MTPIELLSPAKNLACGIAAIDHGADAVYIGGPSFGARSSACNSLEDISKLITYAHQFHARVYVALNTILYENELAEAVALAHELYSLGADALIIQDLGLLACDLPPIPLHASTQLNNRTPEKALFLEQVGFSQIVLARELHVEQIQAISKVTKVPLEFFVHGAICVCYSGQCYMSAFATDRSGNRGSCSQMCRHSYTITGLQNNALQDAYFLSPKDLHLGENIGELINAGIRSFKIEGRMKDEVYVKNITAYFRKKIDAEIAKNPKYIRASHGIESYSFEPNIYKSFSRGFTTYYTNDKRNKIANLGSPKSQGELLGKVTKLSGTILEINTKIPLQNGDGLCFYNEKNKLEGIRINSIKNNTISLSQSIQIPIGTEIWRNLSVEFSKTLEQSNHCRKIEVAVSIAETQSGYSFELKDKYGYSVKINRTLEKTIAQKPEQIQNSIITQASKMGDSIFKVSQVSVEIPQMFFIPISEINEARRITCAELIEVRKQAHTIAYKIIEKNTIPYPITEPTDFRLNISNSKAEEFFTQHGINKQLTAYELQKHADIPLMTTKHCIRFQLDSCPLTNKAISKADPIILSDNTHSYKVIFDCGKCEMNIYSNS